MWVWGMGVYGNAIRVATSRTDIHVYNNTADIGGAFFINGAASILEIRAHGQDGRCVLQDNRARVRGGVLGFGMDTMKTAVLFDS